MTPHDIRIAVARAVGKTDKDLTSYRFSFKPLVSDTSKWSPSYRTREMAERMAYREQYAWQTEVKPVEAFVDPDRAPRYEDDLNACALMEETLTEAQLDAYAQQVYALVARDNRERRYGICATALQRCEAFLRTKGLWVEPTPAPESVKPRLSKAGTIFVDRDNLPHINAWD